MALAIAKKIYSDIKEAIITGRMQSGHMLGERTLALEYNSSKMPVREALHKLCSDGYLVSYPRRGYVVSNINEKDFFEIQQLRSALEMLAIELAVKNANDDELKALHTALYNPEDEIADYEQDGLSDYYRIALANSRFHMAVASLSQNKRLCENLKHLLGEISRAGYRFFTVPALEQRRFHEEIIDALCARDVERAKKILAEDLELPHIR